MMKIRNKNIMDDKAKQHILAAFIIILLVLCVFSSFYGFPVKHTKGAWWDGDWAYKKEITLDHNQVPSTLTNFPVCINLSSDSDLADDAKCQNDGDDIIFTDSSESVQLNHEIEYFDGSTGQLVAWVNVTSLAHDADTSIYMYYGNAGATSQENIAGTWNSDYLIVHHLNETPSNGKWFNDSTVNANNGSWEDASSNGDSDASGIFDGCVQFEDLASDNYIDLGSQTGFKSVSFWVNVPSRTDYDFLFSHNDFRFYFADDAGSGEIRFSDGSAHTINTGVSIDDHFNEWIHIVAVSDGTSSKVYINNVEYTDTDDFDAVSSQATNLGRWTGYSHYSDVVIEELQVFESVINDDLVTTIYNSQNNATDGGFFIDSLSDEPEMYYRR